MTSQGTVKQALEHFVRLVSAKYTSSFSLLIFYQLSNESFLSSVDNQINCFDWAKRAPQLPLLLFKEHYPVLPVALGLTPEGGGGCGGDQVPQKLAAISNSQPCRVMWLRYATAFSCQNLGEDGGVQQIRHGEHFFLAGHIALHLRNQPAHCIDCDWRGFKCNLKIWPFQEFLK